MKINPFDPTNPFVNPLPFGIIGEPIFVKDGMFVNMSLPQLIELMAAEVLPENEPENPYKGLSNEELVSLLEEKDACLEGAHQYIENLEHTVADLEEEIGDLEYELDEEDEDFIEAPVFPGEFQNYGGVCALSDDETQELIDDAHDIFLAGDLVEGEYTVATQGDTLVVQLHGGNKIITYVAHGFYEAETDITDEDDDCDCALCL